MNKSEKGQTKRIPNHWYIEKADTGPLTLESREKNIKGQRRKEIEGAVRRDAWEVMEGRGQPWEHWWCRGLTLLCIQTAESITMKARDPNHTTQHKKCTHQRGMLGWNGAWGLERKQGHWLTPEDTKCQYCW